MFLSVIYYYLSPQDVKCLAMKLLTLCGSGSAVEHRLAKARVAGSIPVFRSINRAALAQLDRAFDYESKGQEFESLRPRHLFFARLFLTGCSSAW